MDGGGRQTHAQTHAQDIREEGEDEDVRIIVSVFFRVARTPPDQARMEESKGTRPNMAS